MKFSFFDLAAPSRLTVLATLGFLTHEWHQNLITSIGTFTPKIQLSFFDRHPKQANFRRRRKRRDAEKSDRPSNFNLPSIPHQTPVINDEPSTSQMVSFFAKSEIKTKEKEHLTMSEHVRRNVRDLVRYESDESLHSKTSRDHACAITLPGKHIFYIL